MHASFLALLRICVIHTGRFRPHHSAICLPYMVRPDIEGYLTGVGLATCIVRHSCCFPITAPSQLALLEFRDLCTVYEAICRNEAGVFEFDYRGGREAVSQWRHHRQIQREVLGENLTAARIRKELYAHDAASQIARSCCCTLTLFFLFSGVTFGKQCWEPGSYAFIGISNQFYICFL